MPHLQDLWSRKFWRLAGRAVDLDGDESWLDAPVSSSSKVADGWLETEAAQRGWALDRECSSAGLLSSMELLDGPGFDSALLRPPGCAPCAAASATSSAATPRLARSPERSGAERASVHVAFPLESGNLQVFLRRP
ncbi:hypothetical protein [Nocardioides sp.]|uniref:hypothetical protein n=1 Tax=Nocardioides sp. TaxID=35761 RepID=UPI002B76C55C|nr:hypothetical protein [Nocardioides sp.]HXH79829.1 hypothetical protein [Nocardioides sp.]